MRKSAKKIPAEEAKHKAEQKDELSQSFEAIVTEKLNRLSITDNDCAIAINDVSLMCKANHKIKRAPQVLQRN